MKSRNITAKAKIPTNAKQEDEIGSAELGGDVDGPDGGGGGGGGLVGIIGSLSGVSRRLTPRSIRLMPTTIVPCRARAARTWAP